MSKRSYGKGVCALVLSGLLLLSGCGTTPDQPQDTQPTEPTTQTQAPTETEPVTTTQPATTTQPTEPQEDLSDASLVSLRQSLIGTPQLFAVACFGYSEEEPTDAFKFMQEKAPQLCENLPFMLHIPNVIGTFGEVYCILPADENATVAVNRGAWNAQECVFEYNEVIYRSESGDPIVLMCNNIGWDPDTEVTITDSAGTVVTWYPLRDSAGNLIPKFNENDELVYLDFSPKEQQDATQINFLDMVGTWKLKWTEVEGDRVEQKDSTCTLTIETDGTGFFWISYEDKAFPDENFTERELLISTGELYPDCGNDQWFATVYQTSQDRMGHAVTLLPDGTLLMQHSFEMDGMPMVSYGWFQRVG